MEKEFCLCFVYQFVCFMPLLKSPILGIFLHMCDKCNFILISLRLFFAKKKIAFPIKILMRLQSRWNFFCFALSLVYRVVGVGQAQGHAVLLAGLRQLIGVGERVHVRYLEFKRVPHHKLRHQHQGCG